MIPFRQEYAFDKMARNEFGFQRSALQVYTGKRISASEADRLLQKIADHKWYVSESVGRDVGFHVAAIDFVENIYQPTARKGVETSLFEGFDRIKKWTVNAVHKYFEAKSDGQPL